MSERKVAESIEILILHCRMFCYGYRDSLEFLIDPIASLYNQFAGLHLISTMFLIKDKKREIRGGVFYRVLQPIGLEHLLAPIWEVMDLPLGNTNFGDYLRISRNKLTTHGDLSFMSLPSDVQHITFDEDAVEQFNELLEKLAECVIELQDSLEKIPSSLSDAID